MSRPRVLLLAAAVAVLTALVATRADGPDAASAAVDLRSPTGLRAGAITGGKVIVRWKDRARGGKVVEVRTSRGGAVRRVPAGRGRITLTAPKPGGLLTVRVRACTRRGGACGPSARLVVNGTGPAGPGTTPAAGVPKVGSCPVRPASDAWNTDVSRAPVDPRSAAYIASIGGGDHLHADFGSGRYGDYGIPFTVVPASQPKVPIRFTAYGDESDPGPYPIPLGARVEGGSGSDGDRHVIVVREGECKLYELYNAHRDGQGWAADAGAVFDLETSALRPAGWTSADAAGLPILPGLARADETSAGAIHHALRFTVSRSQKAYVPPARHAASDSTDASRPPMGLRLRLKASFDRTRFHGQARAILDALRRYGMIVADNGSDWYISGTPDPRWDDDDLDQLKTVPGSAFEVVKATGLKRG
jgi:hypothetical protein